MSKSASIQLRLPAVLLILAAAATCVALWFFWMSADKAAIFARPHPVVWDIISLSERVQGKQVSPGINGLDENLFVQASAFLLPRFGKNFRAMAAVQLPFLVILVIACGLLAWRLAGDPIAGVYAAWLAVFAPTTIGLGIAVDELLAHQALIAGALAALVWADKKGFAWLALIAPALIALGVHLSLWFSNTWIFLGTFIASAGSVLLWNLGRWWVSQKSVPTGFPMYGVLGTVFAIAVGIQQALPFPAQYLAQEANHPNVAGNSLAANFGAILAYPKVWLFHWVGPWPAILVVLSIVLCIYYKKIGRLIGPLGWLLGPMVVFSLISKRNDYYIAAAIPATVVLAALGPALIKNRFAKNAVFFAFLFVIAFYWFGAATNAQHFRSSPMQIAGFENLSFPPMISPDSPLLPDQEELGRITSKLCAEKNRPLVFLSAYGLDPWAAYFMWQADPRLIVNDLVLGPLAKPHGSCLLARTDGSDPKNYTLENALETFRKQAEAFGKFKGKIGSRFRLVLQEKQRYAPVATSNLFVLYAPKD
jgi:hypothetical protein